MKNNNSIHVPLINNLNLNTKASPLTSSLDPRRSNKSSSETFVVTQPTVSKLSSELIKQEGFDTNSRETFTGLSLIPMTNTGNHLMSALNPAHLTDGTGSYFVSGLNDIASNFKLNPSSNTDLPSPSSSSNSSNPPSSSHHHHHHPTRRHGEGSDPTRKREMRLQKNREAARECRRKKKEYIKCLEERVAGLETQNKALIEELRQLKELYCQRDDINKKK